MNTKTEIWNGHSIRFVEKEPGDWWSVAADIADAIGFRDANMATRKMRSEYKGTHKVRTPSGEQDMLILSEKGLYRLIMRSNKPEAEAFQDWVFDVLKTLRQSSGLEAFQEGLLCAFFTAIGQRKKGERVTMNWNAVVGAKGRCKVIVNKWKGEKDGKEMTNNRIDRFLEPEESTAKANFQAGRF